MNRFGHVGGYSEVGASGSADHAFLWTAAEGLIDAGSLGGILTIPNAMNSADTIVGDARLPDGTTHAFRWTRDDGMRDLGTLGGLTSSATAINDEGVIAGSSQTESGSTHAFRWTAADGMVDLGTLGGAGSAAAAINDAGQIVGSSQTGGAVSHAFSWTAEGGMIDLGTLGGAGSTAVAVNRAGHVAGTSDTPGAPHAFLWTPATGMIDLPPNPTSYGSRAFALNDLDQVAGIGHPPSSQATSDAVLWDVVLAPEPSPPVVTVPGSVTVDALDERGAFVTFAASALPARTLAGPLSCLPQSGARFGPGDTLVTCTATDTMGAVGTASFTVTVRENPDPTHVNDVGSLGGSQGYPVAIDDAGRVTGTSVTTTGRGHAFVWTAAGGMVDLGALGGLASTAQVQSDGGLVAGTSDTASQYRHPFMWSTDTGLIDLGVLTFPQPPATPGSVWPAYNPIVSDISDTRQVVGTMTFVRYGDHAFSWTTATGLVDLSAGSLTTTSNALGVNRAGQIVGNAQAIGAPSRAVMWTPAGEIVNLGVLEGGTSSTATAINEAGQVIGTSDVAGGRHAFLWSAGQGMADLGSLGGGQSTPTAISESGDIIGFSATTDGNIHAFRWTASAGMIDLGTLGGASSTATGLNEAGQVVGKSATADGRTHAFVWSASTGMRDLGVFDSDGETEESAAIAINESGWIVGTSGPATESRFARRIVLWHADPSAGITPTIVPGRIEAENYDSGGPGVGYFDLTTGNDGGAYRNDDVDIKLSQDGGYAVGWFNAGEWLAYTVDAPHEGSYLLRVRVGSAFPDRTFHVEVDGEDATGAIAVPQLDDWDRYAIVTTGITFTAGRHVLRLVMGPDDYMDVDWLEVVNVPVPAHQVPGRIEAEDYDTGGPGVGYFDLTAGNDGGAYRDEDVDIKPSRDGGYAVGWLNAGEWLAYTVDVADAGIYDLRLRVGSAFPGRTFDLEVDGEDVIGSIAVPQLSDWDQYQTIGASAITLTAGRHLLRMVMGPEDYMDINWLELRRLD